jgi:hypothetical protein
MNFDSGWEWGYWINDFIVARASWNPLYFRGTSSDSSISCEKLIGNDEVCSNISNSNSPIIYDEWEAFRLSLLPLAKLISNYDNTISNAVIDLLVRLTQLQSELLIYGKVNGAPSVNIKKLSGFAYMSGSDPWVDIPRMIGITLTQPDKLHLNDVGDKVND